MPMRPFRMTALRVEELDRRDLPSAISDNAYLFANERVIEPRQNFYVYRDQDSAFNHGFPSGKFSLNNSFNDRLQIETGCIDDPTSPTGCSTDPNRIDRTRGNVMSLTFAPLQGDQYVGVNIEEPENWGGNNRGRGYDLRGATELVLDVRSPTQGGIRVQFGVGQRQTPFILIPQSSTFSTLTIPLNTLGGGAPDLSSIHVLLTVVTNAANAPNGGIVLIDNARFTPVPTAALAVPSLPLANQTFGVVPRLTAATGRIPFPLDQLLRNPATTYEAALVLLALLDRAQAQDVSNARAVADALVYALGHDNRGLLLPGAAPDSMGLHDAMFAGDLPLFNDQGPGQGQAGDVRLAGFSCSPTITPSGFCLVLHGGAGGNNAFAMLGLTKAYRTIGDVRYLNAARTIGQWITRNLADTSGTGFGGYFNGYTFNNGTLVLNRGKSVENNADIFSALMQLAATERGLGNFAAADSLTIAANRAGDFVRDLFDQALGRFYAGTVPVGTPASAGISPNGPVRGNDVVNTFDFLDSNSFTTLALAGSPRYRTAIDWRRPVQYVLQNFAQTVTAGGRTYSGFNIVRQPTAGPNGVAWEFTGQAVVLMRYVDRLYGQSGFAAQAAAYLNQIAQAQAVAPFADARGLVASTVQNGDLLPPIEQALSTPFQDIAERVGLAATVWAVFADSELNVLATEPARVQSVVVNAGATAEFQQQRSTVTSLTVTFSAKVTFGGATAAAFQLARLGPGTPTGNVTLTAQDLSTPSQTIIRLTFSGALTEGARNSLIDGRYQLTIVSAQVTGNGQALDGDNDGVAGGDYVTPATSSSPDPIGLFRLFGDVNGDKAVNGLDLAAFRTAFGSTLSNPNYAAELDANGDGAVNGLDLAEFRTRFGTTLP